MVRLVPRYDPAVYEMRFSCEDETVFAGDCELEMFIWRRGGGGGGGGGGGEGVVGWGAVIIFNVGTGVTARAVAATEARRGVERITVCNLVDPATREAEYERGVGAIARAAAGGPGAYVYFIGHGLRGESSILNDEMRPTVRITAREFVARLSASLSTLTTLTFHFLVCYSGAAGPASVRAVWSSELSDAGIPCLMRTYMGRVRRASHDTAYEIPTDCFEDAVLPAVQRRCTVDGQIFELSPRRRCTDMDDREFGILTISCTHHAAPQREDRLVYKSLSEGSWRVSSRSFELGKGRLGYTKGTVLADELQFALSMQPMSPDEARPFSELTAELLAGGRAATYGECFCAHEDALIARGHTNLDAEGYLPDEFAADMPFSADISGHMCDGRDTTLPGRPGAGQGAAQSRQPHHGVQPSTPRYHHLSQLGCRCPDVRLCARVARARDGVCVSQQVWVVSVAPRGRRRWRLVS